MEIVSLEIERVAVGQQMRQAVRDGGAVLLADPDIDLRGLVHRSRSPSNGSFSVRHKIL